jgi:hypothetical protein
MNEEENYIEEDFEFFDAEDQESYLAPTPNMDDLSNFNKSVEEEEEDVYDYEPADSFDYDDIFSEIDFSDFSGKFRPNLKRTIQKSRSKRIEKRSLKKRPAAPKRKKPLSKDIGVRNKATIIDKKNGRNKTAEKVFVPDDRKVIIEGVNNFILDNSVSANSYKQMGYLNGKKLKTLVITFNNDSLNDFTIDLFNPSFPLDYLHSSGNNVNDKVKIAGGTTSYTDVLFNMLANPVQIHQAKFQVSGINKPAQINQPLIITNKDIAGVEKVRPFQMQLNVDIDQNQNDMIYFDLPKTINRPYIPDGMDTMKYKVLAGSTITFGFYYQQISLKKFFYKDAHRTKGLL